MPILLFVFYTFLPLQLGGLTPVSESELPLIFVLLVSCCFYIDIDILSIDIQNIEKYEKQ